MSRMGSSCSMQRPRNYEVTRGRTIDGRSQHVRESNVTSRRSSLRHSVLCALPDGCISSLYPVEDNYVMTAQPNMRSPKTLTELCVDALCRSLADLNGELPPGLPRDVVDDVIASLLRHSALNATTLRVLKHCELETLSLAGCRGVTDLWLEPLKTNSSNNSNTSSSASTPTASPVTFPTQGGDLIDHMDLEEEHGHKEKRDDIYCGSIRHDDSHKLQESPSFGSRSSFVSAAFHTADHLMEIDNLSTGTSRSAADTYDHKQRSTNVSPDTWLACSSLTTSTNNTLTLLDLRGSQNLTDRGLLQLTHLHRLKVARLDHCHSLTGRGLLALSHSHQLHTLSLTHCRRLTDEAVIHIAHLGSSLQTLALDGCRCLTDRALTAMADLHHLLRLDLGQCDLLTDHGLAQLEHLSALQELSLGWCRQITDAGLDCLTQQKGRDQNLRVLILARCHHLTDDGLSYLARLQSLEELNLNGCGRLGSTTLGETLRQLRHLTVLDVSHCPNIVRSGWQGKINALKSLDLCYSGVKDSHIFKFLNLSALEELNLDSCPVGDHAIAHLADRNVVPNLTSLDLADTNLTDLGMIKIAKFQKLTRLSLFYCNISNGGLRHIAKLADLEVLNLDSRDISDDGLVHLQKLTKLKSLDIFSGRITDAGCVHIAKIKSLESLELCGGGVGDLGCALLASLDNLNSLNLSQNDSITNRGAAALATLLNLKALNLSHTRVNSLALRYFGGLLKLQSLALYGCRGVDSDEHGVLGHLQDRLPNLKCLRMHTACEEDGTVVANDHDDGSDDDDEFGGMVPWPAVTAMDDDASFYSDYD